MNILFVSQSDPRDVSCGTAQRTNVLWRALQRIGTVDVVVPVGLWGDDALLGDGVRTVRVYNPRYTLHGILQRCFNMSLGKLSIFRVIIVPWLGSRAIRNRLTGGRKYDLVVTRYTSEAAYFALWRIGPLVVDIDDHPLEVYRTMSRNEKGEAPCEVFERCVLMWCNWIYRKCRCTFLANESQRCFVEDADVVNNVSMFPGVGYDCLASPQLRLMTVGMISWLPNALGVDAFIKNYWREIRRRFPRMEYHIIGKLPALDYVKKWRSEPGVVVRGFVDDLFSEYEKSLAVIASVAGGGGTCIKVPEALHAHRICFASKDAMRGMPDQWKYFGILRPLDESIFDAVADLVDMAPKRPELDFGPSDKSFTFEAACDAICSALKRGM